ncbi:MAG: hypothetical protein Q9191_004280 [Dirinaria sp. TL-2023a]
MSNNRRRPDSNGSSRKTLGSSKSPEDPSINRKSLGEPRDSLVNQFRESNRRSSSGTGRRVPADSSDDVKERTRSNLPSKTESSQSPTNNSGVLSRSITRKAQNDGTGQKALHGSPHLNNVGTCKSTSNLSTSLTLRSKPTSKEKAEKGSSMILARNLKQIMHSNIYLICYKVKDNSGPLGSSSKASALTPQGNILKTLTQMNFGPDVVSAITDNKECLVIFSRSQSDITVPGSSSMFLKIANLQWLDILHFIHCGEPLKEGTDKHAISSVLKMLLEQRRTVDDCNVVKARSSTLLGIRSRGHSQINGLKGGSRSLVDVMDDFLAAHGENLHGLEIYLKGQSVRVGQKQEQTTASDTSPPKTIVGLARPADAHGSKLNSPPQVTKYGGGSNDVKFYFKSTASDRYKYDTVTKYFEEEKKQKLLRQTLPVVNIGTRSKPVYIPPERCTLLDMHRSTASELSLGDVADIVSTTNIPDWINNIDGKGEIRYSGLKLPLERDLKDCEVSMTAESLMVPHRIRGEPLLEYAKGKEVRPVTGAWKTESVTLTPNTNPLKMAVLLIGASQWTASEQVTSTINALRDRISHHCLVLHKFITPHRSVAIEPHGKFDKNAQDAVQSELKRLAQEADLILTVLSSETQPLYDYIKRQCDIERGIHNICVTASRFASDSNGYFLHIALKLNLKTVAKTNTITPPRKPADSVKGVAAIVASCDGTLSQWPSDIRILDKKPLHEVLADLVNNRLKLWKEKRQFPPKKVIIYHKGLSDKACADEISSFQKAIKDVKMTLMAVNKDHHARLEPARSFCSSLSSSSESNAAIIIRTKSEAKTGNSSYKDTAAAQHRPRKNSSSRATLSCTTTSSQPIAAGDRSLKI